MKMTEKFTKESRNGRLLAINKLGYVLTVSTLLFSNTDNSLGLLMWHGNENKLVYEGNIQPDIESWIIVPGLGVQSGSGIASTLNDTLDHRANLAYFNYSDDGAQIDEMSSDVIELYNETKAPVNFYAHSMGASITLNVLKQLDNKVPINNIIFDCSPFDIRDAYNKLAPLTSDIAPYMIGKLFLKTGAEVVNNTLLHENKNLSVYGQLKDSARIAVTGSSPRLFANQLAILGDTNSSEYKNYVSDDTRIIYLKPELSSNDETVDVDTSVRKFKQIFGDKVIVVNIKYGRHASPTQRPSEYNSALWPYINGLQEEPHAK